MTNRPRLCFIVTNAITATTFLPGYLRFLYEDGWDVVLLCSDGPGLDNLSGVDGISVHILPMKREPAPVRDFISLVRMYSFFRRLRPDVIVYATPKASLLASIAGRLARVPRRVYELWGLRMETVNGLPCKVFGLLEWLTARLSSIVIANSASLATRCMDLGVNGGHRVVTLGHGSSHGVDSEYFSREATMPLLDPETSTAIEEGAAPVVGFVGRLHPDKGLDTFLEALQICNEQGVVFQALVVGEEEGAGTAKAINQLRERIPVILTGHVDDPRPYLRAMSMLVLVSRREGFPNVVLEAAALEVPAIVSDATGCVDAVEHDITGAIVPVSDPEALAAAIALALRNPEWKNFGSAARKRVVRDFAQETVWGLHSAAFSGSILGSD
ncbi:glycosyltransferase family 4 protein [Glutamicibacter protophormiae]|uniref:Glycosyltransferase involved in cell wall biosynthesis n=1 Tax=Glutamicibacter protophormiae TaxID=37930 RepID=A0ABS4XS28_GLUPR|nr:glycosyltransferase family 4 protein [Glutamicibacter protophormiae]MBP2399310.1 glycosyltransferase involved in cell wall biosynthesis [Glutamicibacter protophormiae]